MRTGAMMQVYGNHFEEIEGCGAAGDFPDVGDVFHAAVCSVGAAGEFVSAKEVRAGGLAGLQ